MEGRSLEGRSQSRAQQLSAQASARDSHQDKQRTTRSGLRNQVPSQRPRSRRSRGSQPSAAPNGGFTRKQKSFIVRMRTYGCIAFAAIMALGLLTGLLFFARPATSDVEKRELTKFPALSLPTFMDGQYFEEVSLWYSDTFPLREPLVATDKFIKTLFGLQPDTMMVGGNMEKQEIPDPVPVVADNTTTNKTQTHDRTEPPSEQAVQAEIQDKIMSGLYVKNGAAYSMYYFDQTSVDTYCEAISTAAEKLKGIAHVYSLLIPTNAYAILAEQELSSLGGANQRQALEYFYGRMGDDVTIVETLDALRDHNDEYIYFRTDHHWTQLGAYYAYEELCKEMGIEPVALAGKEKMTFQPFLGTFYNELGVGAMADNPDFVDAYIPHGTNDMTYTSHDGSTGNQGKIITDVTGWNQSSLYNTFIVADQPYEEMHNPNKTDGSSILIVKDSYGCAFVPLVVDNFEYTYVVDFRYYNGNIIDLVKDKKIQNVVFLNNIAIAGTIGVATTMQSLVS